MALAVKNLPASTRDVDSIPELGRSPGGGNGKPLQYSCLENPMNRGAWGHKGLDTTEQLNKFRSTATVLFPSLSSMGTGSNSGMRRVGKYTGGLPGADCLINVEMRVEGMVPLCASAHHHEALLLGSPAAILFSSCS